MQICREYTHDISILAAALLHDVLEDTPTSSKELYSFLLSVVSPQQASHAIDLVKELTDQYTKAAYPRWNRYQRKRKEATRMADCSPEAQTVKYADIIDNSLSIAGAQDDFAKKYLEECLELLKYIGNGHPQLYQKATVTVKQCLIKATSDAAQR
jgi:(p)ppGpp synthase/HD superfamily hydrolase